METAEKNMEPKLEMKKAEYYVVVNDQSAFMGLTYVDGINTLPKTLQLNVKQNGYLLDGFVLYKKQHLTRVFQNGTQILTVTLANLTDEEKYINMAKQERYEFHETNDRILTTRPIIVERRESLLDPDIVTKYKLPDCNYYVSKLALIGGPESIRLIDKWAEKNRLYYDGTVLCNACLRGHVDVLEWFKQNGLKQSTVKSAGNCIEIARLGGHADKIKAWWKNSGFVQV